MARDAARTRPRPLGPALGDRAARRPRRTTPPRRPPWPRPRRAPTTTSPARRRSTRSPPSRPPSRSRAGGRGRRHLRGGAERRPGRAGPDRRRAAVALAGDAFAHDSSYEVRAAAVAALGRADSAHADRIIAAALVTPSYRDAIQNAALGDRAPNDTAHIGTVDSLLGPRRTRRSSWPCSARTATPARRTCSPATSTTRARRPPLGAAAFQFALPRAAGAGAAARGRGRPHARRRAGARCAAIERLSERGGRRDVAAAARPRRVRRRGGRPARQGPLEARPAGAGPGRSARLVPGADLGIRDGLAVDQRLQQDVGVHFLEDVRGRAGRPLVARPGCVGSPAPA